MDHDKSQNSITNPVKRDNSPISSSSPAHISVNSILRVTTIYGAERIGKVAAYDSSLNLVTLRKYFHNRKYTQSIFALFFSDLKGSKPGLTSVAVINLNHCREYNVEQEPKDDVLEPLYPIDINKVSIVQKNKYTFKRNKFIYLIVKKTSNRK